MNILQLCCVSNLWGNEHNVTNIDIQTGTDVRSLDLMIGKNYDLIACAPPCDQFTKANSLGWIENPEYFIEVAQKCFDICINSNKLWFIENPPGRIEKFIPGLTKYRIVTWHGNQTNKEYVIYSNFLILTYKYKRYGKKTTVNNLTKLKRELWQLDFINSIKYSLGL